MQNPREQIVIYGGRFDPPGCHHVVIARHLSKAFGTVKIMPCGSYSYKKVTNSPSSAKRMEIVKLAFDQIEGIEYDFSDLVSDIFSPLVDVQPRYEAMYPGVEIWHAIGGDLVTDGRLNISPIQLRWKNGFEVWNNLNFAVISHPGWEVSKADLPPHSKIIRMPMLYGRSTIIRKRIAQGLPIDKLVPPEVLDYIQSQKLYEASQ